MSDYQKGPERIFAASVIPLKKEVYESLPDSENPDLDRFTAECAACGVVRTFKNGKCQVCNSPSSS